MIFFENTLVEIFKFVDTDEYDDFGEKQASYVSDSVINADFQSLSLSDTQEDFGKPLTGYFVVFLPFEVEISSNDRLRVKENCYEIVGDVEEWSSGLLPHKRVIVQELRKNERRSEDRY